MIRAPDDDAVVPPRRGLSTGAWIWLCVLLVALTWTPVLVNHLSNMRVADRGAGTLLVVFRRRRARASFRASRPPGWPLKPVGGLPRTWIVQSYDFGFAGRLRERGAWGVYSPNVLSVRQVLSCTGMVAPPASTNPADRGLII